MPFVVKNTLLLGPLDLLFPHSCRGCGLTGEALCECCKNNILKNRTNICPNCKKPKTHGLCKNCPFLPPIYVVTKRDTLLGELIHDYKYHSVRALAHPLAEMLDSILPKNLPTNSVLVPLPTATHHVRARGLDHTYLIAKKLSRIRHVPLERVLLRDKNTVQVGSDRFKRLSQVSSAYTLNPKFKIDPDTTYILLDDVWTTGSSVKAAEKILKTAGAKNIIITLLAYSS